MNFKLSVHGKGPLFHCFTRYRSDAPLTRLGKEGELFFGEASGSVKHPDALFKLFCLISDVFLTCGFQRFLICLRSFLFVTL